MSNEAIQKWEYFSQLMFAEANKHQDYLRKRFPEGVGKYSPRALIPELNELGEEGWELIHIEPIAGSGNNSDIWWQGGAVPSYSHSYFCVFKRPKVQFLESPSSQVEINLQFASGRHQDDPVVRSKPPQFLTAGRERD